MAEDAQRRLSEQRQHAQQRQTTQQDVQAHTVALIEPLVKEFIEAARKLGLKPRQQHLGANRFSPKYYVVFLTDGLAITIRANGKWEWSARSSMIGGPQPFPGYVNPAVVVPQWRKTFEATLTRPLERS
jgi:hypothetical protein